MIYFVVEGIYKCKYTVDPEINVVILLLRKMRVGDICIKKYHTFICDFR